MSSAAQTTYQGPGTKDRGYTEMTAALGRLPLLQFDEVAFGIAHVGPGDAAGAGHDDRFDRAHRLTAGRDHRRPRGIDVVHVERDVPEPDTVGGGRRRILGRMVLKD